MNKKIIVYIILGVLIISLIFFTLFPGMIYAIKDFGSSESLTQDKCEPASGYDVDSWKEHMGHHPNIYKECLE